MLVQNLLLLSALAVRALPFSAFAVRADLKANEQVASRLAQVADTVCDERDNNDVTRLCDEAELQWRLCQRGVADEHLPIVNVYVCFIHSH